MNERRREFLKELLYVVGDERWDLIVNDYHKGGDDFDYAITYAGTGKSMNRIHMGDIEYFDQYLGYYKTPEMLEGLEDYGEVYHTADGKVKIGMLLALNLAIVDALVAQGQYGD